MEQQERLTVGVGDDAVVVRQKARDGDPIQEIAMARRQGVETLFELAAVFLDPAQLDDDFADERRTCASVSG